MNEHKDDKVRAARDLTNFEVHEPVGFIHRTPPSGPAPGGADRTPEERLEDLRFFVIEGEANFKPHLGRWMQEVERQIEALRAASPGAANSQPRSGA